jgi:hypothetical protein
VQEIEGDSVEYRVEWASGRAGSQSHMWVESGEAAFLGEHAPGSTSDGGPGGAARVGVKVTGATDGKSLQKGARVTDGMQARALTLTQDARLTVLRGREALWQGPVTSRSSLQVCVPARPCSHPSACLHRAPSSPMPLNAPCLLLGNAATRSFRSPAGPCH